jgi:hypothetical protein
MTDSDSSVDFVLTCVRCRKVKDLEEFIKPGRFKVTKMCAACRVKDLENNRKRHCEHGRHPSECKICSDPVEVTLKKMIRDSKKSDIKYKRYSLEEQVDYEYLIQLAGQYENCPYVDCQIELQYELCTNSLATIERLNNAIGHTKANCVFCCQQCNNRKRSDTDAEIRFFTDEI